MRKFMAICDDLLAWQGFRNSPERNGLTMADKIDVPNQASKSADPSIPALVTGVFTITLLPLSVSFMLFETV